MDVKIVFLSEELEEEIFMKQPKGFVITSKERKVCKLVVSLFRLKQTPEQ